MAKLSIKNNISIITTFFLIIFFDQLTKILVIKNFQLYESLSILPFFNLTFIVNYGFAFGFLNNPSLNQIIVILVIFSIIAYFLYLLIKTQDQFFRFSLILVLSGAVGNFIDRVLHGFVIDFIHGRDCNGHCQIAKPSSRLLAIRACRQNARTDYYVQGASESSR